MSGGIIYSGNDNLSIPRSPNPVNMTSFLGPPASSISRPQITDHPIFTQMLSLPGVTEDTAFRATIVYLDLFERKQWWRVNFVLNEKLSSILLFGSTSRNGECHVIIPVATETKLTIRNLRLFLTEGAKALEVVRDEESKEFQDSSYTDAAPTAKSIISPTVAPVDSMTPTIAVIASTNSAPSMMRSSPSVTLPLPPSPHSSPSYPHFPSSDAKSSPFNTEPSPSNTKLSPSHPQSSLSHTQSSPSHPQSSPSHPQSSQSHPQSSPSHPQSSPSHPQTSPSHPQSSPSQPRSSPSARSPPKVSLGIVSRDATLVFYQISDGLLLPQRPLNAAQRLERDSLRKLGKKGGPLANEERQWVGDGIKSKQTSFPLRNELTATEDAAEILDDSADGKYGVEGGGGGDNEGVGGGDNEGDNEGGGDNEGDNEGGGVNESGNGGGEDWEEDTEGFWD